jgi:hypothetical protein
MPDHNYITADQGESPIRSLEDVSSYRSLFQVFHPLPSFTDLPLYCSRLDHRERDQQSRMFILFHGERTKKRSFHPHYTVCATNGILSLLLEPYYRLLIPGNHLSIHSLYIRLLLTVLPLTFLPSLALIDIDDYDYIENETHSLNSHDQTTNRVKVH